MADSETRLVLIPDHAQRQVETLPSQFQGSPRIMALARAIGAAMQLAEDIKYDLIMSRVLDSATGAQLDQWGELVRESRGALGDVAYRRFIEARIQVNLSEGASDQLLTIYQIITGGHAVGMTELYPAAYELQTVRSSPLPPEEVGRVVRLMEDVKPGGVGQELVEAVVGFFGFDANDDALGFGEGAISRTLTL